jgi:ribosomal protein L29
MKNKEILKLNNEEKIEKLKELRFELIKKNVAANKANKIRAKNIKKAIARLLTSLRINKAEQTQKT